MAKKAESTLKNMLLSLTVIALVAAAVLAGLNSLTKDTIAQVETKKVEEAIAGVLKQKTEEGKVTDSIVFSELKDETVYVKVLDDGTLEYTVKGEAREKYNDSTVCHIAYDTEGACVGAAVEAADPNGFGGYFKVMVGFDAEGNVFGYNILKTNETPGLGAKADMWFQKGQKGCIIGKSATTELKVKKDKGDVDAITGSTITSRAFLRCVNKAYGSLQAVLNASVVEANVVAAEGIEETENQPK